MSDDLKKFQGHQIILPVLLVILKIRKTFVSSHKMRYSPSSGPLCVCTMNKDKKKKEARNIKRARKNKGEKSRRRKDKTERNWFWKSITNPSRPPAVSQFSSETSISRPWAFRKIIRRAITKRSYENVACILKREHVAERRETRSILRKYR